MRPRINSFGKITKWDLDNYLCDNYVYPFAVKETENTLIYERVMVFRSNKNKPEHIFFEVSRNSKLVLNAWHENGNKFSNVEDLKKYCKK